MLDECNANRETCIMTTFAYSYTNGVFVKDVTYPVILVKEKM
jgi:hypothetical protein